MKVKVLTLRWDEEAGGLDDRELEAFMEGRAVLEVAEHFFIHDRQPCSDHRQSDLILYEFPTPRNLGAATLAALNSLEGHPFALGRAKRRYDSQTWPEIGTPSPRILVAAGGANRRNGGEVAVRGCR